MSCSISRGAPPYPFRHTALETLWIKCPYLPHPSRPGGRPLDEGCPVIGHVALAVIPGGFGRVHAVLGPSCLPYFGEGDSLNSTGNKRATIILDSFRKWWVIHELWCLPCGMNSDVRAWFLKNMLGA
ncbi:hypothetical protein BJX63DRAFT_426548 [Aspergillus granulosus]|uniref:Uncharacterized protein n=1 Tax=Aspergillus granulosus TaxID=176169 RepID=A0ABR4GRR9_9EURO